MNKLMPGRIDDIQDNSKLRRGRPVAHSLFGVAQTINSANYVYFQAMQELFKLPNPLAALEIFNEELLNLHRGQGLDLFWRDSVTCPTEEEYVSMVCGKTGGLFSLSLRLMKTVSPVQDIDVIPLARLIGILFQIQDDYISLCSENHQKLKGYCEDLTEGKFSFPVIHSIKNSASENSEVLNILKLKTEDNDIKAYAVYHMKEITASLEYTKNVLNDIQRISRAELARLGGNAHIEKILDKLVVS
jgi:geranylgeranyl diphosphate synthase type 3